MLRETGRDCHLRQFLQHCPALLRIAVKKESCKDIPHQNVLIMQIGQNLRSTPLINERSCIFSDFVKISVVYSHRKVVKQNAFHFLTAYKDFLHIIIFHMHPSFSNRHFDRCAMVCKQTVSNQSFISALRLCFCIHPKMGFLSSYGSL